VPAVFSGILKSRITFHISVFLDISSEDMKRLSRHDHAHEVVFRWERRKWWGLATATQIDRQSRIRLRVGNAVRRLFPRIDDGDSCLVGLFIPAVDSTGTTVDFLLSARGPRQSSLAINFPLHPSRSAVSLRKPPKISPRLGLRPSCHPREHRTCCSS
jgi:hypothetical protein